MISSVLLLASIAPPAPTHPTVSTAASDLAAPMVRSATDLAIEAPVIPAPATPVRPMRFASAAVNPGAAGADDPWKVDPQTRRYRFAVAQEAIAQEAVAQEEVRDGAIDVDPLEEPIELDDELTEPIEPLEPAEASEPDEIDSSLDAGEDNAIPIELDGPRAPGDPDETGTGRGDRDDAEVIDLGEPPRTAEPAESSESGEVVPLLGDDEQALSITAARQEFDRQRNVVVAEGDVTIVFSRGVLQADRVRVNLTDRVALAEGNVFLKRGEQILRGDRFEYSFVRDSGRVLTGTGEIFQPTANRDFDLNPNPPDPIGDIVTRDSLPEEVQDISATSAFDFGTGSRVIPSSASGLRDGGFNRLRFQADAIDFNRDGWQATNVRITNDPFNPPELEVRANTVNFRSLDADRDEITFEKSRLVFDNSTSVPTFRDRFVLDRRSRPPSLFNVSFDNEDRDGLFIDRTFDLVETDRIRFRLTPQFLAQRTFFGRTEDNDDGEDLTLGDSFGLIARFDARIDRRTAFLARGSLLTLSPDQDEDFRARVRLRRVIGDRRPYTVDVAYNRQERIFNGSLGFQDVNESFGATVTSPRLSFGNTGISLFYRGALQRVTAPTDQDDLLDPDQDDNLATLTRFQGVVAATWSKPLWRGKPLEPTPEEGLRYTPTPIVPQVRFIAQARTVFNSYSNGDIQNVASGTLGLRGQFGHFSRRLLSYTAFSVVYTNGFLSGESPFLFDRAVDTERLVLGLTQQIYGPVRAGARTTISLTTNEVISTDFILEYSRRTYNLALRVNPDLETGSVQLRINAFNFRGSGGSLERNDIRPVTDGAAF